MLSYDQAAHPVDRAKTAPYAVVNHWKTAPGLEGRGGDCFFSGSISTAIRNVYDGLFGIRPTLDGLALDPSLPSDWEEASVEFTYLGAHVHLTYRRAKDGPRLLVNGEEIVSRQADPISGRECFAIPDASIAEKKQVEIDFILPG
jgi:cellobiose phosphorylase